MMKLCVAVLGLMIAPLMAWSLLPALVCIAVLSPFLLGLAVLLVACTAQRSAIKAQATLRMPALPRRVLPAAPSSSPQAERPSAVAHVRVRRVGEVCDSLVAGRVLL
jgi:hypothetical protein